MTRLSGYLSEAIYETPQRSISLSKEKAIELLKNCKNSLKSTLWRGYGKEMADEYLFIDPSKSVRVSANTANYYTLFMDNDPSWKAFPKRSRSIIGATNLERINHWPTIYRVYPYNGAKIGVCPSDDIWTSFDAHIMLSDINSAISDLTGEHPQTYKELLKAFKQIDMFKYEPEFWNEHQWQKNILKSMGYFKSDKSFYQVYKKYMDPKENGFYLEGSNYQTNSVYEFWTDSPCIMLNIHNVNSNENPADNLLS
jgi:hypothetical protein